MSRIELNKIIAAILLASLIVMMIGFVVNILYKPNLHPKHQGYNVGLETSTHVSSISTMEVDFDIAELMKNANAKAGQAVAKKCQACHSFNKGGPNKIGPNLWNVVGSKKASVENYKYSRSLSSKGGIWDEDSLFAFLKKPNQYIVGTKMYFVGLNKSQDIADVIMFLKTFADD